MERRRGRSCAYSCHFSQLPRCENVDDDNLKEWLNCDVNDPVFEQLAKEEIIGKY